MHCTDPVRVARHGMVLTMVTLLAVAYGTRGKEATITGVSAESRGLYGLILYKVELIGQSAID